MPGGGIGFLWETSTFRILRQSNDTVKGSVLSNGLTLNTYITQILRPKDVIRSLIYGSTAGLDLVWKDGQIVRVYIDTEHLVQSDSLKLMIPKYNSKETKNMMISLMIIEIILSQ